MQERRGRGLVRSALVMGILAAAKAPAAAAPGEVLFQVRVGSPRDAFPVARAIEAASARLEGARCRQVLSDFREAGGSTLAEVLAAEGMAPAGHLRRVLFYSGEDRPPCRDARVLAWTTPGSRAVYVCAARFREGYATNPARLEAVILHEMLHTLGLGENPPTSEEITARVARACGD